MLATTTQQMLDQRFMQRALVLAKRGLGWTNPNPMVGCVIVHDQAIIAEGWHQAFGSDHAEVHALKQCRRSTCGTTMYVTLTPCHHEGKTPPCTQAIVTAGVQRVVIAAHDPTEHAKESIAYLKQQGIDVEIGCMQAEALALNPAFYHHAMHKSIYIHAKWAMSLDGEMAVPKGLSPHLSNQQSQQQSHQLRQYCDAILVGVNTIIDDNPMLTVRHLPHAIKPKHPIKIILDPMGRLPVSSHVLAHAPQQPCFVICGTAVPKYFVRRVRQLGGVIKQYHLDAENQLPLTSILADLSDQGIGSVLIEGGRYTRNCFIQHNLVHDISVFLTPWTTVNHKKHWLMQQNTFFSDNCFMQLARSK